MDGTVVVVSARKSAGFGCINECVGERMANAGIANREFAVAAMIIVSATFIGFTFTEVGKHILIGPSLVTELAPMIVVLALAAHVD